MTGVRFPRRVLAAAAAALAVAFGVTAIGEAQQVIRTTPIGGHVGKRARPFATRGPKARRPAPPPAAATPPPLVLPLVRPGEPIPGDAHAANVFRPTLFRAVFRMPRSDARLYVTAGIFATDLIVTVVGPGPRQRTAAGVPDLRSRDLIAPLPADAWRADGIAVTATTVTAHDPPDLVSAETIAARAWNGRWYTAGFSLFAALALVLGSLAYARRSRLVATAAGFAAIQALLCVPFLGIVRFGPQLSQPLDALLQAAALVTLTLFTREYLGDALRPGWISVLWTLAGVNIALRAAADMLQDYAILVNYDTTVILGAALAALMLLAFVAAGIVALRMRLPGAPFYLAGTGAAFLGWADFAFAAGTPLALGQTDPLLGAMAEVLLFTIGLLGTMREPERAPREEIDGLTGLPSRSAFDALVERGWRAASKAKADVALLLVDIDHLRRYNERYGPAKGDDAVRTVAAALALTTRDERAALARYRGATFAAFLPKSDVAHAQGIAKRTIAAIATEGIEHEGVPARRLTVSIGIASAAAGDARGIADVRKRAENALYIAKAMGRNRVVVDEPLRPPPPDELDAESA